MHVYRVGKKERKREYVWREKELEKEEGEEGEGRGEGGRRGTKRKEKRVRMYLACVTTRTVICRKDGSIPFIFLRVPTIL